MIRPFTLTVAALFDDDDDDDDDGGDCANPTALLTLKGKKSCDVNQFSTARGQTVNGVKTRPYRIFFLLPGSFSLDVPPEHGVRDDDPLLAVESRNEPQNGQTQTWLSFFD